LQKYLQLCGFSRRKADDLIINGKIKVNNNIIREPWYEIKKVDIVLYNEKVLEPKKYEYYVLHKPKGYVTTLYDPKEKNTIKKLISPFTKTPLKPAGRLDKDTTGVLILTNDGDLINILTSARYGIKKIYIAKVKGVVNFKDLLELKKGIKDEGEFLKLERFEVLEKGFDYSIVKVEMIKGKKHEIKRLFKNIGHDVIELRRISHGPVDISLVPEPGQIKKLDGEVLKKLLNLKKKYLKNNLK
jgi:23S rRNA pseudouridine2605 synthase